MYSARGTNWEYPRIIEPAGCRLLSRFLIFTRLAAAAVLLTAPSLNAQASGIEVRPVSPELIEVEPGEIVAVSFRVLNRTGVEEEFFEELSLPDGWQIIIPLFEFPLGPGMEAVRLTAFRVPRSAASGDYEAGYSVRGRRDYALTDTAEVNVRVSPLYELFFMPEDRLPERVVAGLPFEFNVRLVNRGNIQLRGEISSSITRGGKVSVLPESFSLPAGESRLFLVSAVADPAESRLARHSIRIRALTDAMIQESPVTADMRVAFDVVPEVAGEDMYHRYPMEFSAYLGGDDDDYGVQFGLSGAGYLDEDRERRLDFLVRAPDRHDRGVFGRRDEYRVMYREPVYTVRAGDQVYGLSPLTSLYRYGRGLGLDLHYPRSRTETGIYYARDRWRLQKREDTGGYVSFSPAEESFIRLNLLLLDYGEWRDLPSGRDNIASLQGAARLMENERFEAEVGLSDSERKDGATDSAWRLGWRGETESNVRYSLAGRRARPDYAGRYSDTALYSGALSFPLGGAFRGRTSYNRYERNLASSDGRGAAPRENLYQAGVAAGLPAGWRMNLDFDYYEREDIMPEPAFEIQEHAVRLGAGRSAVNLSYRAEARRSRTENVLAGETHDGWNYRFYGAYRKSRRLHFSFYGGFGDDHAPAESRLLRQGRHLGGALHWIPSENLSLNIYYSRYDRVDPDIPIRERVERDHYGAALSYVLENGHRLTASVRRSESNLEEPRNYYLASYSIPFSVSTGRRESVGALEGRLYRADKPGRPGVPGAVVYVDGTAARTDSEGRYIFKTLQPGEYEIRLDELSVGLDYVKAKPDPVKASVYGGRTTASDIALVRSGELAGTVRISDMNNNNPSAYSNPGGNGNAGIPPNNNDGNQGLGNILIEISRPGETRRTVTDSKGRFLFQRLYPCEWNLVIYPQNLPEHHHPESGPCAVAVEPGQTAEITVQVLPRLREIRFIDGGRVSADPRQ